MKMKWSIAIGLMVSFVLWTVAVRFVDVAPIGPDGSAVGFAALNGWFHRLTGVHMILYTITDWLGLVPIAVCFDFAGIGLYQWIRRRSIRKVDGDILLLGGFYVLTIAAYLLFESVVINYRPILIEGYLEVSYPSSTTLLTLCVMTTALMQWRHRLRAPVLRRVVMTITVLFIAFMVVGRMFSGESLFMNDYTPQGGSGMIAFAASFPGSIIPYQVTPGNGIVVQKRGFLAMEKGLELSMYFQKKLGKGFFGGEGFIMQKITGNGMVFLEIDGYCKEYDLAIGESIVLDTGYLAAMSETCAMDVEMVNGAKNIFLGGEGLFHTRVTGPGKVYVQSMPVINLAERLTPYIKINTGSNDNSGGINIKLGD